MRYLAFFMLLGVMLVAGSLPIHAQTLVPDPLACGSTFTSFILCIWRGIFYIAISLAVLMFLLAAFFYLTSGGDPKRIENAKGALLWGIIGLGIVIISGGLIFVICDVLGVAGTECQPS